MGYCLCFLVDCEEEMKRITTFLTTLGACLIITPFILIAMAVAIVVMMITPFVTLFKGCSIRKGE